MEINATTILDNMIVSHLAGSRSYGTSLPSSDTDYRGVFVAPPEYVRTPFFSVNEVTDSSQEDTKYYELSQFMKLCIDCNPNIIETCWVDKSDVVVWTPEYSLLRESAPKLLSSKVAFTMCGYATSQLNRIKGHSKWLTQEQNGERKLAQAILNNTITEEWVRERFPETVSAKVMQLITGGSVPDSDQQVNMRQLRTDHNVSLLTTCGPRQADYISLIHNFTAEKIFAIDLEQYANNHILAPYSKGTFGVYAREGSRCVKDTTGELIVADVDTSTLGVPLFIIKFNEEVYKSDRTTWQTYHEWRRNRNPTRNTLEQQFGYDTKHAMHLVRLLRMGAETLEDGVVYVKRKDAQELLDIRAGKWTYNELVQYADHMNNHIQQVLYPKTVLPKRPDLKFAADLTIQLQDLVWNRNLKQ